MITKEQIIAQIKKKKSAFHSAEKLGIPVGEYIRRKAEIKSEEVDLVQESSLDILSSEPLSPDEIKVQLKIDDKWELVSYWNSLQANGQYLVSANVRLKKEATSEDVQDSFIDYLTSVPSIKPTIKVTIDREDMEPCCLVLPKQDAHYNKYDILGNNNIYSRLQKNMDATKKIIRKATNISHLHEIVYVIGSDEFNSEFTNLTTKGTPQQNILTYEGSFHTICQHEVDTIILLSAHTDRLIVKYVPGNHDQYVGWHLASWLAAYFREDKTIHFDTSMINRKYHRYGQNGIMINHGDVMKFSELAGVFPMEFKEHWGKCSNFYIFTGDKHHEKSLEIHGIKIYQIPQLSGSRSFWDDKHGYTVGKPEMTGFLISADSGMSDILKVLI